MGETGGAGEPAWQQDQTFGFQWIYLKRASLFISVGEVGTRPEILETVLKRKWKFRIPSAAASRVTWLLGSIEYLSPGSPVSCMQWLCTCEVLTALVSG